MRSFSLQEISKLAGIPPPEKEESWWSEISFIGMLRAADRHVHISALNRRLSAFGIDAVISIMDLDKIHSDGVERLACRSLAWYPNHFSALDLGHIEQFRPFSDVVGLCPTDTAMLKATLGATHAVVHIPHVVQLPPGFGGRSGGHRRNGAVDGDDDSIAARGRARRQSLRRSHGVPVDAFVVLVNCANYETTNRKSLDISILAFKRLREVLPEAFLYRY